jgi:hypothetical protein
MFRYPSKYEGLTMAPTPNYMGLLGTLTAGPSAGSGKGKYAGGVLLPDGRVVFVPSYAASVGVYDPATNKFTVGPSAGSDTHKYLGGVLRPDGRVVFVPSSAASAGIYKSVPDQDSSHQPAYTVSVSLTASWSTALLPYYNKL